MVHEVTPIVTGDRVRDFFVHDAADRLARAYDDLVARLRPARAVDAETGIALRFVRDYTITPDPWTSRMDWYLFAADLSSRVQSGRERLGE